MSAVVQAPGPVLVGVDGSGRNASAVAWAAAEAASSTAPLILVHDVGGGASVAAGRATVDRATAQVARIDRELQPVGQVVSEGPAEGLRRAAAECENELGTDSGSGTMVVVGRRGAGGFTSLNLGSTARMLVHRDGPPTVVVPSGWDPNEVPSAAPVIVDGTTEGEGADEEGPRDARSEAGDPDRALSMAMARASRDGRPLVVVAAWSVDAAEALGGRAIPDVWAEHARRAEHQLEERLGPWRTAYPEVAVSTVVTDRHPVAALLDQAQGAELVVVPRGWRGCAVVEYAQCPVAVV